MREKVIDFINNSKDYPLITGLASGLYPMLYYYNANFTQVNSLSQFLFFSVYFVLLPIIIFVSLNALLRKTKISKTYKNKLYVGLNLGWFGYLILLSTIGLRLKYMLLVAFITLLIVLFFSKHLKKLVVFQLLLAGLSLILLIPNMIKHVNYSKQWLEQPDNIESVVFKHTPNIYFIQADGYANVEELDKGHYNYDNSSFNSYLEINGFSNYKNYRSNYYSTLSSNSSLFGMKHHYYSNPQKPFSELLNARHIIVTENPVLSILKSNNYKTHLLMDKAYFLINRPTIGYDYCNVEYSEVSFMDQGFWVKKDLKEDLKSVLPKDSTSNNFYFVQKLLPSHVTNSPSSSVNKITERKNYLNRLKEANIWLKEVVALIENTDNNALIIIAADHGGFVGFNTTLETQIKQTDRDLIYSIYTAMLAVKWNGDSPSFDNLFKTPVNFFRILFSCLSQDKSYLQHLQEDKSYIIINEDAPFGVYEYIDHQGNTVFNPVAN